MKDPNANRKGYKQTKVGWLPSDWGCQHFADGFQKVISEVKVDPSLEYTEIGVRSHGRGIFKKEPVLGKELGKKRVFWIKDRCVLFNIVFAWEQAVAVTSRDEVGCIASHRFPMYEARAGWDTGFCSWHLRTARGKYSLGVASPGGAGRNRTLGNSELAVLHLPKPPLAEAKKIVAILDSGDRLVSKLGELIRAKQQQKKALVQQLLTGKKRLPGFSKSRGKTVTRTGEIPADWSWVHLGEVFKKRTERCGDYLPLMAVTVNSGLVRRDSIDRKVDSGLAEGDNLLVREGDIAYNTMRMWQGAVGVAQQDCHVSPAYVVFTPVSDVADAWFYYYWFKSEEGLHLLWSYSHGITGDRLRLYADDFALVPAPLPPINEQRAIVAVIKAAESEIVRLQQKQAVLKQQTKGLMHKLLTGQVRVKV